MDLTELLKTGAGFAALERYVDFSKQPSLEGEVVGLYRVGKLLAEGGMSRVYRAERNDGTFERTVAIKILNPQMLGESIQHRFISEAQILANLNHPNIGRMFDAGLTDSGLPYIVLEFIEGKDIVSYCQFKQAQ